MAGLAAASPALAAKKIDVVVLRNGDRVTCEVEQLERGRLRVKTDDMGTLQIEWDKVRSVSAAAQFDVEDLAGQRYVGSLEPGNDGELRVASLDGASVVRLADVASMYLIRATLWRRLEGSLDIGASYASASELFKLDVSSTLGTNKPGYEISAAGSTSVTQQTGAEDTSRSVLSLSYVKRFEGRWVLLGKGQVEQNSELGFDLRSSVAAGGGYYVVRRRRTRLLATLASSVNREKPVEGESTTNVELAAFVGFDRFSYDFPKIDVSIGLAGFASLSDPGRARVELEGRLQRELVKDFYTTLRGYASYDNRPPVEGAARSDWGVTFALGWSF